MLLYYMFNLKYYFFFFLKRCPNFLVFFFFNHLALILYVIFLAVYFSINIALAVDLVKPINVDGEVNIVPFSVDHPRLPLDDWKQSMEIISHPKTSNAEALATYKKNKLGLLYGSYGNDGAAIKNEVPLANIIAAQLDSFLTIPSKFISSTQTIYFEGSHIFPESFFQSDTILFKNNIQPFICKVINDDGLVNWALINPDILGKYKVEYFKEMLDIQNLNKLALNPDKFIIMQRPVFATLNLPIAQHTLGDFIIVDTIDNSIVAVIEAKNLTREASLARYLYSQKQVDFYAHFENSQRLYETFVNSKGSVYFNNEFKDQQLITSPMAYKQLIQAKPYVMHNMPRLASSIIKYLI